MVPTGTSLGKVTIDMTLAISVFQQMARRLSGENCPLLLSFLFLLIPDAEVCPESRGATLEIILMYRTWPIETQERGVVFLWSSGRN